MKKFNYGDTYDFVFTMVKDSANVTVSPNEVIVSSGESEFTVSIPNEKAFHKICKDLVADAKKAGNGLCVTVRKPYTPEDVLKILKESKCI